MKRFVVRILVHVISAAIALLVVGLVLPNVTLHLGGFVVAVLVYTAAQAVIDPLVSRLVASRADALLGGVGIISTFVALVVSSLVSNGIEISGIGTWIAATVIVWLVTALATIFVPRLLAKTWLGERPADA